MTAIGGGKAAVNIKVPRSKKKHAWEGEVEKR
jgi:hypothetical protein